MRDSERYRAEAEEMARLAKLASKPPERARYEQLAQAWSKLAGEAERVEDKACRLEAPKVRS